MTSGTNTAGRSVSQLTIGPDQAGQRIDNFLVKHLKGVPRTHVYRLLRSGQVRVNSGRKKAHYRLKAGDLVRIPPVRQRQADDPVVPAAVVEQLQNSLLYEDANLLAINKPAGLAVHKGSGLSYGVIEAMRQLHPGENLELVHRLDRDTSGCLLLAKNRQCLNELHSLLRQETDERIEKTYLALVAGRWRGGDRTLDAPLRKIRRGGEHMIEVSEDGDRAVSHFQPLEIFADCSLMQVRIETGRTHQIRVHALHAGHPLIGDTKYGDRAINQSFRQAGLKRLFLHAWRLRLPLQPPLDIEAPLAHELHTFLDSLRTT